MLPGSLCHLSHGPQLVLAAAQRGASGNLSISTGMTLENTSVKQAMCVQMTPKAHFSLYTVSTYM